MPAARSLSAYAMSSSHRADRVRRWRSMPVRRRVKSGTPRVPSSGAKRQSSRSLVVAQILREEPLNRLADSRKPSASRACESRVLPRARARIDQQLQRERDAGVACEHRADRGERAARAVAADREPRRVDPSRIPRRARAASAARRTRRSRRSETCARARAGNRPTPRRSTASRASMRHSASCVSMLPTVKPPPWKYTSAGAGCGPARLDRLIKARANRRAVARRDLEILERRTSARGRRRESARFFRRPRASCAAQFVIAAGALPGRSCRAPARSSDSAAWWAWLDGA